MKSKTQPETLCAVLPNNAEQAMTVQEIYDAMDPADRGRFGTAGNISKAIDSMRRRGFTVLNGKSDIVNGKTRLTWYLKSEERNDGAQTVTESDGNQPEALMLDPNNEIDAPFIAIISAIRNAQNIPEPVLITNKAEKIHLIRYLHSFYGKINEDFERVLADIADDLERLQEAA